MVHTTFLWPQKDGTSITDLPEDYRGLGTAKASSIDNSEIVNKLDSLPWDKAGEEIVLLYDEFVSGNVKDSYAWFTLGIKLVGGDFWDEALDCFKHCCDLSERVRSTVEENTRQSARNAVVMEEACELLRKMNGARS